MSNRIHGVDPNVTNPDNPGKDQAPVDPSNTSNIGQRVEQGVIDSKGGISEQSSEWEDKLERTIPQNGGIDCEADSYIKNPSPEEINIDKKEES